MREPRLWTPAVAADYIGMTEKFLEADRGGRRRIPFYRIGNGKRGAVRYARADLNAFLRRMRMRGRG